jgi:hypothetical protein
MLDVIGCGTFWMFYIGAFDMFRPSFGWVVGSGMMYANN